MKSLFVRMLLWFCAANGILIGAIVLGYAWSNPDQLPYVWPRVGKGAIVSAGRTAVETYERGGQIQLALYFESLEQDTALKAALYDASGREVSGSDSGPALPSALFSHSEGQLMMRLRGHLAGVRLRGSDGQEYAFVATVPRRVVTGFWSRAFMGSLILTGAVLCYLLARHVTAPVVHIRAVTSRFSRGDLAARITMPGLLGREDEVGGLARDFNQMASRIETLMKAQQRLIADVSHELRSPITRLSLALGLVRRRKEGDVGGSIARMEREVERLNVIIGQLLTLSRLESLNEPPPMERLDLSALVKEISADADFEAASMDRSVQLVECAPCSTRGARDLLRSAVENVVRNAVKYTSPNTEVLIRLVRVNGDAKAAIVVEDQGPGVPEQALDHVFEPFYRADEARDRRSGGAGLGLAITHQILTLHGGSIRAVNRASGGLEMRMTLPVDS